MKSNLLREMQQLFDRNQDGNNIPVPNYLFVQRYGREINGEMNEITSLLGQKGWFSFSTTSIKNNEKLLTGFQVELERNSGVGKEYAGSVLIEFSGNEEEKELEDLLDYIYSQRYRLHCVYTIKDSENTQDIKRLLENYGFVRVVQGEEYEASEQIAIFVDTIAQYQYKLEKIAKEYIDEFFRKQKWQEEDAVKIRIQNIAKEIVYNKLMNLKGNSKVIRKAEVENVIQSLQCEKTTKRQMGFVMGGAEFE